MAQISPYLQIDLRLLRSFLVIPDKRPYRLHFQARKRSPKTDHLDAAPLLRSNYITVEMALPITHALSHSKPFQ